MQKFWVGTNFKLFVIACMALTMPGASFSDDGICLNAKKALRPKRNFEPGLEDLPVLVLPSGARPVAVDYGPAQAGNAHPEVRQQAPLPSETALLRAQIREAKEIVALENDLAHASSPVERERLKVAVAKRIHNLEDRQASLDSRHDRSGHEPASPLDSQKQKLRDEVKKTTQKIAKLAKSANDSSGDHHNDPPDADPPDNDPHADLKTEGDKLDKQDAEVGEVEEKWKMELEEKKKELDPEVSRDEDEAEGSELINESLENELAHQGISFSYEGKSIRLYGVSNAVARKLSHDFGVKRHAILSSKVTKVEQKGDKIHVNMMVQTKSVTDMPKTYQMSVIIDTKNPNQLPQVFIQKASMAGPFVAGGGAGGGNGNGQPHDSNTFDAALAGVAGDAGLTRPSGVAGTPVPRVSAGATVTPKTANQTLMIQSLAQQMPWFTEQKLRETNPGPGVADALASSVQGQSPESLASSIHAVIPGSGQTRVKSISLANVVSEGGNTVYTGWIQTEGASQAPGLTYHFRVAVSPSKAGQPVSVIASQVSPMVR